MTKKTPDQERYEQALDIISEATAKAFGVLLPEPEKATAETVAGALYDFARLHIEAHRIMVGAITDAGVKRDESVLFSFQKAIGQFVRHIAFKPTKEDEEGTMKAIVMTASREVMAAIPAGSSEEFHSNCHHSVIWQFALVEMMRRKDARLIRATVDNAIRQAIQLDGDRRESAKERGTIQ